ncbi:WAP four-disulfide core domain protein 10A [Sus scrofa]|uniref:WAP domain-containing protein n=2 Tax=Sus scrofa TaxID=9823 RepID=A0A8D0J2P9_PIG|nr:WAP four-disulfide core domain protein 10A [Sus scrofa]
MKWWGLQWLMLSCLAILPASGNWQERISASLEALTQSKLIPGMKPCKTIPTKEQCTYFCDLPRACPTGLLCCSASCGNVCMPPKGHGNRRSSHKISNFLFTAEPIKQQ